jgi:secreted trypsin-like serine protease
MGHVQSARRSLLAVVALALFAAAGSALAAAGPGPGQRIVGGEVADPGDWRFAAALEIKLRDRKVLDCGASVISPRYAITAAHCAISVDPRRFSLVVGRANLRRAGQGAEVKVTRSKVHPEYGPPNFRNDVAILELKRRVSVPPVALPTVGQNDALTTVGSPLEVAGWGGTRPNGSRPSKRLRTMTETVVKPAKCRQTYGRSFSSETTICTRGPKLPEPERGHAGSCYGDSGGPLVAETPGGSLLIGTVSGGGLRCGTSPDYYARVSDTLRFIRRVTGVTPRG